MYLSAHEKRKVALQPTTRLPFKKKSSRDCVVRLPIVRNVSNLLFRALQS